VFFPPVIWERKIQAIQIRVSIKKEDAVISTTYKVSCDKQLHYITFFAPVSTWKPGWIVDTTEHGIAVSNFTILDGE
jgi:hypothetical protein